MSDRLQLIRRSVELFKESIELDESLVSELGKQALKSVGKAAGKALPKIKKIAGVGFEKIGRMARGKSPLGRTSYSEHPKLGTVRKAQKKDVQVGRDIAAGTGLGLAASAAAGAPNKYGIPARKKEKIEKQKEAGRKRLSKEYSEYEKRNEPPLSRQYSVRWDKESK